MNYMIGTITKLARNDSRRHSRGTYLLVLEDESLSTLWFIPEKNIFRITNLQLKSWSASRMKFKAKVAL
jgi:hypothetical protein